MKNSKNEEVIHFGKYVGRAYNSLPQEYLKRLLSVSFIKDFNEFKHVSNSFKDSIEIKNVISHAEKALKFIGFVDDDITNIVIHQNNQLNQLESLIDKMNIKRF